MSMTIISIYAPIYVLQYGHIYSMFHYFRYRW